MRLIGYYIACATDQYGIIEQVIFNVVFQFINILSKRYEELEMLRSDPIVKHCISVNFETQAS